MIIFLGTTHFLHSGSFVIKWWSGVETTGTDWGTRCYPTDNWLQSITHTIYSAYTNTKTQDNILGFQIFFQRSWPFPTPSCWSLIFDQPLEWRDRPKSMTKSYDNMSITLARLIPSKLMISPQIKTLISGSFIILGFFLNLSAVKFPPFHPIYAGYISLLFFLFLINSS